MLNIEKVARRAAEEAPDLQMAYDLLDALRELEAAREVVEAAYTMHHNGYPTAKDEGGAPSTCFVTLANALRAYDKTVSS